MYNELMLFEQTNELELLDLLKEYKKGYYYVVNHASKLLGRLEALLLLQQSTMNSTPINYNSSEIDLSMVVACIDVFGRKKACICCILLINDPLHSKEIVCRHRSNI